MAAIEPSPKQFTISSFWKVRDWRMGFKLLIAFLLIVVLSLAFSAFLSIRSSSDALVAEGILSLTTRSSSTGSAIDQYLDSKREDTVAIGNSSPVTAFILNPSDAAGKANALKELKAMANRKYYESIAVYDREGTALLSSSGQDDSPTIKTLPYFVEAMKGASYVSDPYVSFLTNQPSIFMSAPIPDASGKTAGVLVSRLSLYGIWDLVEKDTDAAGPGTFGLLLDENGIRIAEGASLSHRFSTEESLLFTAIAPLSPATEKQLVDEGRMGRMTAVQVRVVPLPQVAAAMKNAEIRSFESTADSGGGRHYAAISSLKSKPWRYVLMTPAVTFTGPADQLGMQFIALTILVAAIAGIAAIFLARVLTQPIVHLTRVADRISLGELDAKIEINSKDEIGELAQALRRMQASIQAAMRRARQARKT